MFNLHDFIFNNLISGYKNGSFTKEQVSIYSVNYMTKGLFTETDVEKLNEILSEEPAEDTADSVMDEEITEETTTKNDAVSVDNSVIDEIIDNTYSDTDAPVAETDEKTTTGTNDGESVAGLPEVE